MATKVYLTRASFDGTPIYPGLLHPTQTEALKKARELRDGGYKATVLECTLAKMPIKELVATIYNTTNVDEFCLDTKVVKEFEAKKV